MPAGKAESSKPAAGGPKRPPWVKEGPQEVGKPTAPWMINKRSSGSKEGEAQTQPQGADGLPPRKSSTIKITPSLPSENGSNTKDPHTFDRPVLRPAPKTQTKLQSREIKVPVTVTSTRRDSQDLPSKLHIDTTKPQAQDTGDRKHDSWMARSKDDKTKQDTTRDTEDSAKESKTNSKTTLENTDKYERKRDNFLPKVELKSIKGKDDRRDSQELEIRRKDSWLPKVELKPVVIEPKEKEKVQLPKVDLKPIPVKDLEKAIPSERNAIVRADSLKKVCPAPPPMPPMPPPPPPPEMPPGFKRDPLSEEQREKLESLRSRPRKRPDWGAMMKEVESGRKLKHVECNDRSSPLLPENKAKGQFIYESEKANLHNQLLRQIQTGTCLKHVKTNDRSKPILEGLRKFRRQMTIEEQIQKSQSMANMPEAEVEEEVDEMDDIDKVRDDLQSTKQMLALELRNKEAQIRENKRLLSRLQSLEAEVERMKAEASKSQEPEASSNPQTPDDKILKSLKEDVVTAKKTAEEMEHKYHDTADQLDATKNELDEARRQNRELEKKLQQAMQGIVQKRQSFSDRRESFKQPPPESEEEFEESEESEGEETEEKKQRRAEREVRMLDNKLKSLKNKQETARKERMTLRDQMKKNQQAMKQEKKKYKSLQKEVNKMAALMKDDDEEDEDDEKSENSQSDPEESESESESETESSSEEEEESSSEEEDEPQELEAQKARLQERVARHDRCLAALKKGNYLLKATADRVLDDLNKTKEEVVALQADLDSVLAELG